ncbi:hypothetical protein Tco_0123172 [Tanacetum coccineum]
MVNPTSYSINLRGSMIRVPSSTSEKRNVIKAFDCLARTHKITRVHQTNTPKLELYTEINVKETQGSKELGLPRWQSVCSHSHPRAMNQSAMIRRNGGSRLKGACKNLEASSLAYKKEASLAHRSI